MGVVECLEDLSFQCDVNVRDYRIAEPFRSEVTEESRFLGEYSVGGLWEEFSENYLTVTEFVNR